MPQKNIKTIFFDYDGTLHNGLKIYAPAFRTAYAYLVENGFAHARDWTDEEISYWLGFNPVDMWNTFMPDLDDKTKTTCTDIISAVMKSLTELGKAELYEGSEEVLAYLKNKGYRLVFISNCKNYYRDVHRKMFRLERYFEDFIASEEYGFLPKKEILASVKDKYEEGMAIIGDRIQDIDGGKENNFLTVGCNYGYGSSEELQEADFVIEDILELKNLF